MAKEYKVGIYVRLSNEDSRAGESVSVENQKIMLLKHVKEMGWELTEIYQDDGFSGTNQNRPAFQRMMADVKQGHINTILIKDLSRLGRNYLEVGNLAEVFLPEHGCELISLNEKLDDMMVFRNWFNEQHSKSTSKKVKAAKNICAENGKYLGTYAPYGFMKDPDNRHRFIIDENTALIVRRIFELRAGGVSAREIMIRLNNDGITPPQEYYYQTKNRKNPRRTNGLWADSVVKSILRNEAYIGNMVQGKVGTVSYKNSKLVRKERDEWIRAENTHEAIISRELWDRVQALLEKNQVTRRNKDGGTHLFSSVLYCADCGFKLRGQVERKDRVNGGEYRRNYYTCGNYARSGKAACTIHSISESALTGIVTEHIHKHALLVEQNEDRIIETILAAQNNESTSYHAAYQSEVEAHGRQIEKLDLLIENLYNDKVTGVISEDMFKRFVTKYEQERIDRLQSVETLIKRIQSIKQNTDNAETWANLIRGYARLEALDSETVLLLIDKVIIGESHLEGTLRVRDINIVYNYVGDIDRLSLTNIVDDADGDYTAEVQYDRQAV
jgi:DNA invertase Pin-like site-specific DNA recombinase